MSALFLLRAILASAIATTQLTACGLFMPKKEGAESSSSSSSGSKTLSIAGGNNSSGVPGATLAGNLVVIARNANGTVASGVIIDWTIISGGGSVSPSASTTAVTGLTSTSLTLGATAGTNTVRATIRGTSTYVTFNETASGPFTTDWNFDTLNASSTYTYSSTKIQFSGGIASLSSVDQDDSDDGSPTGFSGGTFCGTALSSSKLVLGTGGTACAACDGTLADCAALAGNVTRSGYFLSRILDIGGSGAGSNWNSISWLSNLPYGKELPDNMLSEAVGSYVDLDVTPNPMATNVALWHLNEANGNFADSSGNGNTGTPLGNIASLVYQRTGVLQKSVYFDGSNYFDFGTTGIPTGVAARTVSVWFKQAVLGQQALFSYGGAAPNHWEMYLTVGQSLEVSNGTQTTAVATSVSTGVWHHAAATFDGVSTTSIYLDGALVGTSATLPINTFSAGAYYRVASGILGSFIGDIDEVAVWSRALSSNEISQLYYRGAAHVQFQVRSCNDNACAGETWIGSAGNNSTYFSEIHNNSIPLTSSGNVLATLPSILFSDFGITLTAQQYFQYKVFIDTIGSSSASAGKLTSTSIGPNHYDQSNNTIENTTAQQYTTLASFTEDLTGTTCTGGIRYVLSPDNGSTWYWYNAGSWQVTGSPTYSTATSAATITGVIGSLPAGSSYLKWRAFLPSDGSQACGINKLTVTGVW